MFATNPLGAALPNIHARKLQTVSANKNFCSQVFRIGSCNPETIPALAISGACRQFAGRGQPQRSRADANGCLHALNDDTMNDLPRQDLKWKFRVQLSCDSVLPG